MTGDQLNAQLGYRLEDGSENIFGKAQKVDAINNAMTQVVSLVDNVYLDTLEAVSTGAVALGSGGEYRATFDNIFTSALSSRPTRSAIIAVRDYTGGVPLKWCTITNISENKNNKDNAYFAGTTANPICQIFNESIWVQPSTINQIQVWYLKPPIVYTSTSASSMASECDLNTALEPIVLDLAEAELWRSDGNLNRADRALQNAMTVIQILNNKHHI